MLPYVVYFYYLFAVISGESPLDQRIVGGVATSIKSLPYQVSIEYFKEHLCGGTVIQQQYILTAAHCVEKILPFHLSVRAGSSYRNKGGILISVCSFIIHNQYNNLTLDYDVAVLLLCQKLPSTRKISPIPIASATNEPKEGSLGLVSGWGSTREEGRMTSRLRKANVVIIDHNQCKKMYRNDGVVTSRMLCAGAVLGSVDSCQGDSGGPLVSQGKLAGIVSWGYGCGRPFYPGVYTRVAVFRCWIKMLIGY